MEVCNIIINENNSNENNIGQAIDTININRILDDVVEKIESSSEYQSSSEYKDESNIEEQDEEITEFSCDHPECPDVVAIDINKHKHSECTICTESVSDSSSEPESENFKCDVCSNHVHPICMYNYGIYHELSDLNSIPCYVCEKGTLRPNNSIGRKLRAIAERLRGTTTVNRGNTENENNLEERLLDVSSPRRVRREILERSGYLPEHSNSSNDSDDSEDSEDSEVRNINANSLRRQRNIIRRQRSENYYSNMIYNNAYCCLIIVRGICLVSILIIIIAVITGIYTKVFYQ